MNKVLETNLNAFYQRFPHYKILWAEKIESLNFSGLQMRGDGDSRSLLESGKLLDSCSLTFPIGDEKGTPPGRVLLMEGFGLGANIRRILDSPLKNFQNMMVVEPSLERFIYILKSMPVENLFADERIHYIVGATSDEAFSIFMNCLRVPEVAFRMDASRIIKHPILSKKTEDYFSIVWDEWNAATKQIRRHFGGIDDSLIGFNYLIENIPWIQKTPGVLNLKNKFKGIPAIIISTGPSLTKSLESLKALQDKAVLLSADASLNILLDHGIVPHFTFSLERDNFCKKFYIKATHGRGDIKTNLVAFPFVPLESISEYKGPQFVAYRDMGYFYFFEHSMPRGIISSSSSVAHFCLRFADFVGASEVALVGQDLSFDPDTFHSHPDGIAYEEWAKKSSLDALRKKIADEGLGDFVWVEGNLRAQVPTHSTYFSFMKEFAWESTQVSMPVVNCTEGGAKIPEIPWKKLSEYTALWQATGDLFERISQLREIPQGDLSSLKVIEQFLLEVSDKFKTILALTEDSQMLHALAAEKQFQTLQALRGAQTDLFKDPRFVCFIIQNSGRELLDVENQWACLSDQSDFTLRLGILRRWTQVCMDVALRLHKAFIRAAS